jgi:hypothetical protein
MEGRWTYLVYAAWAVVMILMIREIPAMVDSFRYWQVLTLSQGIQEIIKIRDESEVAFYPIYVELCHAYGNSTTPTVDARDSVKKLRRQWKALTQKYEQRFDYVTDHVGLDRVPRLKTLPSREILAPFCLDHGKEEVNIPGKE